ncbi:MAG: polysaccharide biosynthesis/export family protein [Gemmatimonadaceae bacterium]
MSPSRFDRRLDVVKIAYLPVGLVALLIASSSAAQTAADSVGKQGTYASRAWLESQAEQAEAQAAAAGDPVLRDARRGEAETLRARLRDGDFQVGDRLAILIQAIADTATIVDTVTVRAGRLITVRSLPEISLNGILRAEAEPHVKKSVSQYLKDPTVQVTPLLRVAILGEVGRPGFYSFPADVLVSDAIMAAGGPTSNADLGKTEIKRESRNKVGKKEVSQAIVQGRTMDELNVRAGDEIIVGTKRTWNWTTIARSTGALLALAFAINRVARN